MPAMKKKKEVISFKPIEGLKCSDAELTIVKTESTKEGTWTDTSVFPYMKFGFEKFNPMQSGCLKYWDQDVNLVVSSFTASGKTTVIEGIAAYTMSLGKKVIYTSPMKALSNEKISDWENVKHDFSNKKVCILTGDVTRTEAHLQKLNDADLNILTSECLDVCCRNAGDNRHSWIKDTGALIVDEAHTVGVKGRGDKIEASIVNFAKLNPDARIIFLSATMPNIEDFKLWLTALNGKTTVTYTSNYRPCDLEKIFIKFTQKNGYKENEAKEEIIKYFLDLNPNDSCLAFVGSKKAGQSICDNMSAAGVTSKFFKADLPMEERAKLYSDFNNREFKLLVCTSAIIVGCNLAARRIFITATTYGPYEEIATSDLNQAAGRAGRPQYESEGTAIFLLKEKNFTKDYTRIIKGEPVLSQMLDPNIIAFHVLAEIMNKRIQTPQELVDWYKKTLACHQARPMELWEAREIFSKLSSHNMISENTDGSFSITQTGIVTAQFYLVPEDMSAWIKNFTKLFNDILPGCNTAKKQDIAIGRAVACIPSWMQRTYVSSTEKEVAEKEFGIKLNYGIDKIGFMYYLCLNHDTFFEVMDREPKARMFYMGVEALRKDVERIISALSLLDIRTHKWRQQDFWSMISNRFKYGVPAERLALCSLDGVGGARSKDLYDGGIRSISDVLRNQFAVIDILGERVAAKVINSAKASKFSDLDW